MGVILSFLGIRTIFAFVIFLVTTFAFDALAGDCPLQGRWDTGFFSSNGQKHMRLVHEFDCDHHATLRTILVSGMLLQRRAEVYERKGTYQFSNPVADHPGLQIVDIVVNSITYSLLDPNSVDFARRGSIHCAPTDALILKPYSITGRDCDGTKFAPVGYIERAVAKIESDRLFWSVYWGENQVIVQDDQSTINRKFMVNENLPFILHNNR